MDRERIIASLIASGADRPARLEDIIRSACELLTDDQLETLASIYAIGEDELIVVVEYDRAYWDGEYSGTGNFITVAASSNADVGTAFQKATGIEPAHIIHYQAAETDQIVEFRINKGCAGQVTPTQIARVKELIATLHDQQRLDAMDVSNIHSALGKPDVATALSVVLADYDDDVIEAIIEAITGQPA